ncbi:MAG: Fe-S cluster assembly ATPase SufC [Acidimicrobiia bacterium]|nr:Fe-S cluster assembly ATPase SufC [Acidimicrobiia bacterium]MYH55528.1 Fe-S cluster assembly ATPase SufC [Acidimicrobiia bacterium]
MVAKTAPKIRINNADPRIKARPEVIRGDYPAYILLSHRILAPVNRRFLYQELSILTASPPLLTIEDLQVSVDGQPILRGVDLVVNRGEIHAMMGPNGSGKSTLAKVLMGHPSYEITRGTILFKGEDITEADPPSRARMGMFLAFQYPEEVPGVTVTNFLRTALSNRTGIDYTVLELRLRVMDAMNALGMDSTFADRYVNQGFSGGERKRNEVLQMAVLEPELAIMDETDSGLDIDALKVVAEGVNRLTDSERGFLVITHYQRLLDHITPHHVHVLVEGRIVESGGAGLARRLEDQGYESLRT